jgi:hypothetical protein
MFAPRPAVATTPTTAAATASKTATAALFTRPGDVHCEIASMKIGSVQRLNGRLRCFIRGHGEEGKASGAATEFIQHQIDFDYGTVLGKQILKIVFGHVEGEIPDK